MILEITIGGIVPLSASYIRMHEETQIATIVRKLQGRISDSEEARLQIWLNEKASHKQFFNQIQQIWENASIEEKEIDGSHLDKAWVKFSKRIEGTGKVSWINRYAAAILILIGGLLWFFNMDQGTKIQVVTISTDSLSRNITLPDGSLVQLNQHSQLSYNTPFESRYVEFQGEAIFDVVKNVEKPFSVFTKNAVIRVLGTSFNVRAYPDEDEIEVAVKDGHVAFEKTDSSHQAIVLKIDQTGILEKQSGKLYKKGIHIAENSFSWQSKKIRFENTNLTEVFDVMERYYKAIIEVENEDLFLCHFTGIYENKSIEEVLTILEVALGITYTSKENIYIIKGGSCN